MKLSTFIITSITLSIQYYADQYRETDLAKTLQELEPDLSLPRIQTYDFIIVGGGDAGCLLAGRLSQNFNVLLIESGGKPVPASYNPYLNRQVQSVPSITNFFVSQRQFNFTQETGGIIISPTGRMLGGSWSHGGNMYMRGSPHDFDHFAKVTGDEGWSYRNILQHFKNVENFQGRLVHEGERHVYYGSSGPLYVETDWPPITEGWFQSGRELGFEINDPNGYQKEGFTPVVKSIKNGERVSTYTAFLKPFESSRPSLKVLRYSDAQNILIDASKRAYGVAYLRHGIPQIAHASKEIIISCGIFSTPLLLLKSGIGRKEVLASAGIPLKQDLPGVGQNLKNHAVLILRGVAHNPNWSLLSRLSHKDVEGELDLYQNSAKRSGYFTEMEYSPQAFIVSSEAKSRNESNWPDLRFLLERHPPLGVADNTVAIQVALTRPQSVGVISLNTSAFLAGERNDVRLALIDHRALSVERDVNILIEGIKLALRVMEGTTTFRAMNVTYLDNPPAACRNLIPRSDAYWRCHIRERATLVHLFAGSCKMGRLNDPYSVVDSKLRVKGIRNLRIVDASIMPQPTNANSMAPTMVIAEKAYQEIFNQYLPTRTGHRQF